MSSWIDIMQALLTPTIGLVAASVAWQQYRLAKQKHDIDIFDRRMQVYKRTVAFLDKCEKNVEISENEFYDWLRDVADAEFLFGQEILDLLTDIEGTSSEIITKEKINPPQVRSIDDEYEVVTIDPRDVDRFNDFLSFRGRARELFAPYFQTFLRLKALQKKTRYKEMIKEEQAALEDHLNQNPVSKTTDQDEIPF